MPDDWAEPRLPKETIAELALGIFRGDVFTSWQIQDVSLTKMIFMLMLLSDKLRQELAEHPPALFCAQMKDAFPHRINGYPMFHAFRAIYRQDAEAIFKQVKRLEAAAKEIAEEAG